MLVANVMNTSLLLLLCFSGFLPLVMSKPCSGTATYKLSFQGEWTSGPSGARFSGLIGCSHNHCYQMFKIGEKASLGVKNVAEKGELSELNKEILGRIIDTKHLDVLEFIESRGSSIGPEGQVIVPETNTTDDGFRVDGAHSLVSAITGIVPSPDWFVGVEDFDLCNTSSGHWFGERRQFLFPYDAGTDSGRVFNNSVDEPTYPREKIAFLNARSLYDNRRGMGYFVFTLRKTFPFMKDGNYECGATSIKWSAFLVLLLLSALITVF